MSTFFRKPHSSTTPVRRVCFSRDRLPSSKTTSVYDRRQPRAALPRAAPSALVNRSNRPIAASRRPNSAVQAAVLCLMTEKCCFQMATSAPNRTPAKDWARRALSESAGRWRSAPRTPTTPVVDVTESLVGVCVLLTSQNGRTNCNRRQFGADAAVLREQRLESGRGRKQEPRYEARIWYFWGYFWLADWGYVDDISCSRLAAA